MYIHRHCKFSVIASTSTPCLKKLILILGDDRYLSPFPRPNSEVSPEVTFMFESRRRSSRLAFRRDMHALRDADFPGDGFMIIQGHRGKCKPRDIIDAGPPLERRVDNPAWTARAR